MYLSQPWNLTTMYGGEDAYRHILFDIHITCRLKARDIFGVTPRYFFHMCWMDIQDRLEDKSLHDSWKRHHSARSLGSDGSIGTVCTSVRAFRNLDEDVKN